LNEKFQVQHDLGTMEVELIEATEIAADPRPEQFSIVFRGPTEPPARQGMYKFEHDQMGDFDLFIVPIGQDDEGRYYEAAFSRLRQ
jgi:hypothetical protein